MQRFKLRVGTAVTMSMVLLQLVFVGGSVLRVNAQEAEVATTDSVVVAESAPVESAPATDVSEAPAQASVAADESVSAESAPVTADQSVSSEVVVSAEEVVSAPASEPVSNVAPVLSPELTSEKADYEPGDVASIFGNFFSSLQNFVLRIFGNSEIGNHYTDTSVDVATDSNGSFSYNYQLDNFYRPLYTMVASTPSGSELARATFTDAAGASINEYSQCSNDQGIGYATGDTMCRWTNGNLQPNNSKYTENDATVQRLALSGLANGSHTVTIEYQTTKGGKHAYDFLTDDVFSENWTTGADLCESPISGFPSCASLTPNVSPLIPTDLNAAGHDTATNTRHFKIRNGVITNVSAPTLVSGSYGADSATAIQLTFTVDTTTCVDKSSNKCPVLITWGAHISSQADWGAGSSAVNISGSPYHVKVVELDGSSVGSRDNQMQADTIVIPNTITIHKVTSPNGGTGFGFTDAGGLSPTSFSLNDGDVQVFSPAPGSYTVVENNPSPAYALTGLVCNATGTGTSATTNVGTRTASITIGSAGGGVVDCTYTNTLQQGHLTLVKTVTNDNGGGAAATAWTLSAAGPTPISGATGNASITNAAVNAGTYTLSETNGPAGYAAGAWVCVGGTQTGSQVTLAAGENATCTINNNDISPTLTLVKTVVNNNGGQAEPADFQGKIDGNNVAWNVAVPVLAGVHTASEVNLPGYTAGDWGGACTASGTVSLALGENKICTITNDDLDPILHVIKHVINDNGGTKTAGDFNISVTGQNPVPANFTGSETGVTVVLDAGAFYTVVENAAPGYVSTYSEGCSGTLTLGQEQTCVITNDDQPGHLVVHKVTDPTDTSTQFSVTATGGIVVSPAATQPIVGGSSVNYTVNAGTYSVTEADLAGWDETANDCVNVVVPNGETKECTVTNTKRGHIIIVKDAINNNAQDFTFNNNFGNGNPASFLLDDDSNAILSNTRNSEVLPGTYAVSEDAVAGWQQESATCDAGETVDSIDVAPGETVTCTFVNEQYAKIVLVKNTVGGDGEFDFDATGTGLPSDIDFTTVGGTATQTFVDLDQDNTYSIKENVPAGWTLTSSTCTGSNTPASITPNAGETVTCTFTNVKDATLTLVKTVTNDNGGQAVAADFQGKVDGNNIAWNVAQVFAVGAHTASETNLPGYTAGDWTGDCAADGSVTLAPGENKVCTITNDDQQAYIVVDKTVLNNNGGTAEPNDFLLTVDGGAAQDEVVVPVNPGTHTAGETNLPGYTAGVWGGDCNENGTVSVALGETKTCTITNDDQPAHLIVTKHVVNDNGGSAEADDFTITVANSALPASFAGSESGTDITVDAGTYSASEGAVTGYTQTSNDCSGTIANGETKTCTIVNDDQPGTLIVKKVVVNDNGGTLQAQNFSFQVNGESAVSFEADGQNNLTVNAGTYLVTEPTVSGYLPSYSNCSNLVIPSGGSATCTITNNDVAPQLTVIKHVINDSGDVALASDFTMQVTGTNVSTPSFPGSESGVLVTLNAGTYSVDEASNAGYVKTLGADCAGTIAVGESKTCTITNNDIPHPTRTQGFWQTHTTYTTGVFSGFGGSLTIGSSPKNIDNTAKLFAAFYANISKQSDGKTKRSALDQARMQMLQQWVAAKLNCQAFTCSASTNAMLSSAATAWTGTNVSLILSYASQIDAYNNSNDALPISGQGKATPAASQTVANPAFSFWNILP